MTAATVNSVKVLYGKNEEVHDVTFAATGDTYAPSGINIADFQYSVVGFTGTNANGVKLALSSGTFTLTLTGTANTSVNLLIRIRKSR